MNHFRPGGFELAAKVVMLCLRGRESPAGDESPAPASSGCGAGQLVPSRRTWRAHQYPLQASRPWNDR